MLKKLYAGAVLTAAVLGIATSSTAGPDCDAAWAGGNCDDNYNSEVIQCGFLAEQDIAFLAPCLNLARANYEACTNSSSCSG